MRPPCPWHPECGCDTTCDADLARRSIVSPWQVLGALAFAVAVGFVAAMAVPGVVELLAKGGW